MTLELIQGNRARAHQLVDEAIDGKGGYLRIISKQVHRSEEQNKLQFRWLNQASLELKDDTTEGYRGYCKLHFAVPIMRSADDLFRAKYDKIIRPLPYHVKLECMMTPLDFPVTRMMNTKQMAEYLDQVYIYLRGLGVDLQQP